MASNTAFLPLQPSEGVDNFLSNYRQERQYGQQQQDRQRTYQRQDRQDQMAEATFAGNQSQQQLETAMKRGQAMALIIGSVRDGDVQGFEAAKARAVQELGLPPDQVSRLTINDLPRLRAESGQAMRELEMQHKRAQIESERARANAANARARGPGGAGAKAPSGYQYVIGEDGQAQLQIIPGGPHDPMVKPLTDEQAKAAGFAARLRDSDTRLWGPNVSKELMSGYNNTVNQTPLISNALVTNEYQVGDQARRDFLNAQLRRESGAVIADSEFTSGQMQYFPEYADKDDVLLNKAAARKQAIYNMYVSAGPRYAKEAEKARSDYDKTMVAIQKRRQQGGKGNAPNVQDAADAIVGIKR